MPAHAPGISEVQQTNLYPTKFNLEQKKSTIGCSVYQCLSQCTNWTSGAFKLVQYTTCGGHRKYNGSSTIAQFELDYSLLFNDSNSDPKESCPNNISLVPIIKVRNSNIPDY